MKLMGLWYFLHMKWLLNGEVRLTNGSIIKLNDENELSRKTKAVIIARFSKYCFCYKIFGCFCSFCENEFDKLMKEYEEANKKYKGEIK